jgi:hypothetical protein
MNDDLPRPWTYQSQPPEQSFGDRLSAALRGVPDMDPLTVMRRTGINVPYGDQVHRLARALMENVGPQADVQGMVNDSRSAVQSYQQGDYMSAMVNALMAGAGVPMMAVPGTVNSVRRLLSAPGVPDRANELADMLRREMPDAKVEAAHNKSQVGDSSYVRVYYKPQPGPGKYVGGEFRVSDHGVGPGRAGDYLDLIDARDAPYDATPSIERLLEAYRNLKGQ